MPTPAWTAARMVNISQPVTNAQYTVINLIWNKKPAKSWFLQGQECYYLTPLWLLSTYLPSVNPPLAYRQKAPRTVMSVSDKPANLVNWSHTHHSYISIGCVISPLWVTSCALKLRIRPAVFDLGVAAGMVAPLPIAKMQSKNRWCLTLRRVLKV